MTDTRWRGGALIRPGILAFAGSIGTTTSHAHHAVQVMTADTPLTVADGSRARHCGTQVVVPPDTAHHIETGAAHGVVVFLDPDSAAGRAAGHRAHRFGWAGGPPLPAPAAVDGDLGALVAAVVGALVPDSAPAPPARHRSVTAALALLPALVADGPVTTTDLAVRGGLSTSRLTHLFGAQVGLPLRRYVLWTRLMIAVTEVGAGRDLTTAAHAAGFADSAHLTRTCRDIFGLPPSALSRTVTWDTAPPG
ncbi:helix-turn-helix domain-containing protein [Rhodococcus opacus]|uniref:helix-turn-helix domain-containing protein n=1 Tax=Rhodococcus opacus TaxID=37919 RepID=UPI001C48F050|nr:AraC family transcriptional regulator [Rhodococcus opacus]MBV6761421.1 AraC family transcriptional regulator [Rhodococcus opacus]